MKSLFALALFALFFSFPALGQPITKATEGFNDDPVGTPCGMIIGPFDCLFGTTGNGFSEVIGNCYGGHCLQIHGADTGVAFATLTAPPDCQYNWSGYSITYKAGPSATGNRSVTINFAGGGSVTRDLNQSGNFVSLSETFPGSDIETLNFLTPNHGSIELAKVVVSGNVESCGGQ